ncbi:MAG TPA: ATP-dependent Clp protease adaptor ClpS [Planctomycetaceae bacterium]|nr:ATP-dependent Clp protease adaptor ClpS [Planctomycetaceae bacterium]
MISVQEIADEVVVSTAKPAPKLTANPKPQPPYAVIVENDDFHTFEYVIGALSKVCGHSRQKAFLLAVEIDAQGKAVVWSGTKELAELKRDQIHGMGPDFFAYKPVTFPLGVYIEPLP